jgi:hypothetical protein
MFRMVFATLKTPADVAGFIVVHEMFNSVGEAGPGDDVGVVASKTYAIAVREQHLGQNSQRPSGI